MGLKFDLDPTLSKVTIIAILLFLEGLLMPIYAKLQQGVYPSWIEFFTALIGAILIVCTYLMAFVKTGSTEPPTNQ